MKKSSFRNLIAFWILGLANNYGYVLILSAADDLGKRSENSSVTNFTNESLPLNTTFTHSGKSSTGVILLVNILPSIVVKSTFPFVMHRIPYGLTSLIVVICQITGFILTALFDKFYLIGVAFASAGSGLGEICFLSLAVHYETKTLAAWSSGTGGAGIFGSLMYALLTERDLFNLKLEVVLLISLIVSAFFVIAYWIILIPSPTIYRLKLLNPKTWITQNKSTGQWQFNQSTSRHKVKPSKDDAVIEFEQKKKTKIFEKFFRSFKQRFPLIISLLRYMIPLSMVYFAQYLINQGIVEKINFKLSQSFFLPQKSQYRWYQAFYQIGVFISRSSVSCFELTPFQLFILPLVQFIILVILFIQSLHMYLPHIVIVFILNLLEGFVGGAAYVNTFNCMRKKIRKEEQEFSLSVTSSADSIGITFAGIGSMLLHNFVYSSKK